MEKFLEVLKYFVAVLGTMFTWLFGSWDLALEILIVFGLLLNIEYAKLLDVVNVKLSPLNSFSGKPK